MAATSLVLETSLVQPRNWSLNSIYVLKFTDEPHVPNGAAPEPALAAAPASRFRSEDDGMNVNSVLLTPPS